MTSTITNLPAIIERDPIDEHFAQIFAFMDRRPKRPGVRIGPRRSDTVASRRGKGLYPSPVAYAEFAGGEKIRMSFWQHAGKPWRFEPIQRWLCVIIGNERARAGTAYAEATADLDRKIAAARAIADDPGINLEEADTARRGVERLQRRRLAKIKAAQTAVLDALSAKYSINPPATDCISFHIEHNGARIVPPSFSLSDDRSKRRTNVSKNYDVTIKWHTPADATVRETVVKTWASSPKLADKIGLRGGRLDGSIPKDAIIDAPANEPLRVVEPEPEVVGNVIIDPDEGTAVMRDAGPTAGEQDAPKPIDDDTPAKVDEVPQASRAAPAPGAMLIASLDDLKRAIATPGIVISVVAHWKPQEVGTTRTKMKRPVPANTALLQFNEDGSVTFYPKRAKSWTLAFMAAA